MIVDLPEAFPGTAELPPEDPINNPPYVLTSLKGLIYGDILGNLADKSAHPRNTIDGIMVDGSPLRDLYGCTGQQALMLCWAWKNLKSVDLDPTDGKLLGSVFIELAKYMWKLGPKGSCAHRDIRVPFKSAVLKGYPQESHNLGSLASIIPASLQVQDPDKLLPWAIDFSSYLTTSTAGQVAYAYVAWTARCQKRFEDSSPDLSSLKSEAQDLWCALIEAQTILAVQGEDFYKARYSPGSGEVMSDVPWVIGGIPKISVKSSDEQWKADAVYGTAFQDVLLPGRNSRYHWPLAGAILGAAGIEPAWHPTEKKQIEVTVREWEPEVESQG